MATSMGNVPHGRSIDTTQRDFNAVKARSGPLSSQPHWSLKRFLQGQPKALGVVQIMISLMHAFIWIIMMIGSEIVEIFIVAIFLESLTFLISGSFSVASENRLTRLRVKCSLGWNIVSCCTALIEIILICVLIVLQASDRRHIIHSPAATYMMLRYLFILVSFIVLEFCIALSTSVFACKTLCYDPNKDPVDLPMGAIPVSLPEPQYEALTSRPPEYATIQMP